jgi:spore germination cell wall hydrolase CwlJ-like protein
MAAKEAITDPAVRELTYIVHGVVNDGWLRDTVKGATHYHVATMNPRPAWAQGVVPVIQIARHVFYAGVK